MKRFAIIAVIVIAFILGRLSDSEPDGLPGVPVAFLQMTQPIAVTIQVELDAPPELISDSISLYALHGTAEYRFTNISNRPISLAFPPVRTISISSNSVSHDEKTCPPSLAGQQTINIPAHKYVTFKGEWSEGVSGGVNISDILQPSAGWSGFTFRPPQDREPGVEFCDDTLIAFQTFNHQTLPKYYPTIDHHLRFVSHGANLTPLEQGNESE